VANAPGLSVAFSTLPTGKVEPAVKRSTGLLLLGLIGGAIAVLVFQRVKDQHEPQDVSSLDEKVSLHLAELEDRVADLAPSA
jgi:hypothetical protein